MLPERPTQSSAEGGAISGRGVSSDTPGIPQGVGALGQCGVRVDPDQFSCVVVALLVIGPGLVAVRGCDVRVLYERDAVLGDSDHDRDTVCDGGIFLSGYEVNGLAQP